MEIFNRETNPRDGDDDEEESGVTGNKRPKKESWFDKEDEQDKYHWLYPGASGNLLLPKQEGMFDHLLGESKEDDEEDEDDEEEDKNKEVDEVAEEPDVEHETTEAEKPVVESSQMEPSEDLQAEESQEEPRLETDQLQSSSEEEQPAEKPAPVHETEARSTSDHIETPKEEEPKTEAKEPVAPSPPQESMATQGQEKPKWLEEDEQKFQQIMEREADESFKKAASNETLTSQEPGQEPPAVERTTNESVSLEPEPTHQVEGFRGDEQFEGVAPGPARPMEGAAQEANVPGESGQAAPDRLATQPDIIRPSTDEDLKHRFDRLNMRQRMATSLLFMAATYGYFANRRRKREVRHQEKELKQATRKYQTETERMAGEQQEMRSKFEAQQEQLARMQAQQRAAQEASGLPAREQQAAPRPEVPQSEQAGVAPVNAQKSPEAWTMQRPEFAAPGSTAEAARAAGLNPEEESDEDNNKLDAEAARRAVEKARETVSAEKPQQHVEQDAWRRYVVDEQGHEVHEAMRYGHEYDEERAQETLSGDAGPAGQKHHGPGQPVFGGSSPWQQPQQTPAQYEEKLGSGQPPTDHSLPAGMPTQADWQHQLPEKHQNPIVSALTSPWLFLLLSLILLAYFIATLF